MNLEWYDVAKGSPISSLVLLSPCNHKYMRFMKMKWEISRLFEYPTKIYKEFPILILDVQSLYHNHKEVAEITDCNNFRWQIKTAYRNTTISTAEFELVLKLSDSFRPCCNS